jgi:hypothetical protein
MYFEEVFWDLVLYNLIATNVSEMDPWDGGRRLIRKVSGLHSAALSLFDSVKLDVFWKYQGKEGQYS